MKPEDTFKIAGRYDVRSDELLLLWALQTSHDSAYVRNVVNSIGMPEKRAAWILSKWTSRGWYDYGVNILAGWLTPDGRGVQ